MNKYCAKQVRLLKRRTVSKTQSEFCAKTLSLAVVTSMSCDYNSEPNNIYGYSYGLCGIWGRCTIIEDTNKVDTWLRIFFKAAGFQSQFLQPEWDYIGPKEGYIFSYKILKKVERKP